MCGAHTKHSPCILIIVNQQHWIEIPSFLRYLAPYATVELALILIKSGQIEEAAVLLETAKYDQLDKKYFSKQAKQTERYFSGQATQIEFFLRKSYKD